ncbi:MAG TPA: SDR family NAD(P)-dependent oxidoreductase [Kofleriaceae bacterium]|nr:SDR family NAD(P)-dependent oxidoreductase [Kofleriaceae bacterium]
MQKPVALVTGASKGIGAAIAAELAAAGYLVAGIGRDRAALDRQAAAIGGAGFHPFVAELTCAAQLRAMVEAVRRELGEPAVLVNNAGYGGPYSLVHETADEHWSEVLAINATAPFLLTRAVLPAMARAGFGRIVNISSVFGTIGGVGSGAYIAAKHALVGLTKAVAAEYAACGITCNAVCPGICETDMTAPLKDDARLTARVPAGRFGRPEEVARMVTWLCSAQSSYLNGAVLPIDGGVTADLALIQTPRAAF